MKEPNNANDMPRKWGYCISLIISLLRNYTTAVGALLDLGIQQTVLQNSLVWHQSFRQGSLWIRFISSLIYRDFRSQILPLFTYYQRSKSFILNVETSMSIQKIYEKKAKHWLTD